MRIISLFSLLLIWSGLNAQKYSVFGHILDSTKAPLAYATVAVSNASDSVMIGFSVTNEEGFFRIALDHDSTYLLKIVLIGYTSINDVFTLTKEDPVYDYGQITMTNNQLLKTFDMVAEGIPMIINGDTIEYNAEAFKTSPNAAVEELLKQLPGVEIDEDGNIKAQGEEVKKVYVNGKEFFGDDPKMATKNLPADAIKKVQVYDRKSENSDFTGVDDGQRDKTINIELKPDKKAGLFGNLTGGYGTEDRFKFKANANKFTDKVQLSVIGMANNTSEDGFSWSEYMSFMGGFDKMYGNGSRRYSWSALPVSNELGNGLITTYSGGVNLNYQPNKKIEIATNYFLYKADKILDKIVYKNNSLDSNSYESFDTSYEQSVQWIHRMNMRLDYKIDSMHLITVNLSGDIRQDDYRDQLFYSSNNIYTDFENNGGRTNSYSGNGFATIGDITFKKKFKTKGRSLVLFSEGSTNNTDYNGFLNINRGYISGASATYDTLNQSMHERADNFGFDSRLEYIEPLGKNRFLEMEAAYGQNNDDNLYDVYDVALEPNYIETFNPILSADFRKGYSHYSGKSSLRWIKDKFNINTGVRVKNIDLIGTDFLRDNVISRSYVTVLPDFKLSLNPRKNTRISVSYDTDLNVPSIEQLQTKVDNSDPTRISTGNPNLRPEYSHDIRLGGHRFSQFSMSNFWMSLSGSYVKDMIQYASVINEQLISVTQPLNVDKNLRISGYVGYSKEVKKLGGWVTLIFDGNMSQGIFFLNSVKTNTNEIGGNLSLRVSNNSSGKLTYRFSISLGSSLKTYDASNLEDFRYNSINGFAFVGYKMTKKWNIVVEYDHAQFRSSSVSNPVIIPLFKSSLSRYIMDNERGEIKVQVFDLFNQNRGLSQTARLNYYQETRTNSIGRYYMLSFTYSLTKMKKEEAFFLH